MEAVTVLMLIAVVSLIASAWWLRRSAPWSEGHKEQIHLVCEQARTIVDLTSQVDDTTPSPDTATLSALVKRIHHLDARLRHIATREPSPRVHEAIEDVRRVASSLAAALDAERFLRLRSTTRSASRRAHSSQRITERSAELDGAVDELHWLTEARD